MKKVEKLFQIAAPKARVLFVEMNGKLISAKTTWAEAQKTGKDLIVHVINPSMNDVRLISSRMELKEVRSTKSGRVSLYLL